nr:probable leucine-rich repeat receptor-like protein kinase IMK3 [Ipomoea trifida]
MEAERCSLGGSCRCPLECVSQEGDGMKKWRKIEGQGWDGVIITQADFQALQAFKQGLVDPKGFLKSWNDSGVGACSGDWVGIKCAQGQVIVIQLPWKGLGGKITDKIGQFQALRKLSLHDNVIGGSIPTTMGLLPNLRGVQLFNNRFTGSIPASLGLCRMLQTLDLSNNSFSGSIPDSLVNSTKLFRLNVSYNSLSGSIPQTLTQSPSIIFLDLKNNNLSGPIPDSWGGKSLFQIKFLSLDHNSFSGTIPASIGKLNELQELSLSHNHLSGFIPNDIAKLSRLTTLDLSLSGRVPTRLSQTFNSSAFAGNLQLCGYSPSTPCPITPAPATPEAPSPETPRKHGHKLGTKDIILIAAGALLVILLLLCCILICCLVKKRAASKAQKDGPAGAAASARGEKGVPPTAGEVEAAGETGGKLVHFDGPMVFAADDLLCATAEIMGKSTYGTVYKATLEDGNQVAVKRLREKITKGQREFESEVNILGKIRHPNLLALRAYYLGPKGEKLLVFDYMAKGSLTTYLHGALGYRAPELSKLKKANTKTDVYSLGVIILELLTGKSPGEAMNGVDLPQWVASIVKEEWTNEVFDLELMRDASTIGDELLNTLKLALHCVDPSPSARPEVQLVLQQLEEIRPETASSSGDDGATAAAAAPTSD